MLGRGPNPVIGDATDCRDMCPGDGPRGKELETMLPCLFMRWLPAEDVGSGGEKGLPGC